MALRRYILALSLVAATVAQDGFLRQGCLLTPDPDQSDPWEIIERSGKRSQIVLTEAGILDYAKSAAAKFGVGQNRQVRFLRDLAKQDVKKK